MTEEFKSLTASLEGVVERVERIEEQLAMKESPNGTAGQEGRWQYLIARPHRWRRQLSVKGRNLTVGQLVSTVRANRMTPEQASEQLDLPLAAIEEALIYYAENRGLIELEASEERRQLAQRGLRLEPENLPR